MTTDTDKLDVDAYTTALTAALADQPVKADSRTDELREALLAPLRVRIARAEAEMATIARADRAELYRRYQDRFWRR